MTNKTMAICESCGAHIKHVHTFNGKSYGGDCVQVAAGLSKWEVRTAAGEIDAYLERKANRADQAKKREQEKQENELKHTQKNGWIIDFLEKKTNDFAQSLANQLKTRSIESLSEKQRESILWFWVAPYANIQKGYAMFEFIAAIQGVEPHEIPEAQNAIASYATLAELKEILKDNGVKGFSKMKRIELEEVAAPFIKIF